MTTFITAAVILLAFVVGVAVGRFDRSDRRVTRQPPLEFSPRLVRLWRAERVEHNPGMRVVRGGRR